MKGLAILLCWIDPSLQYCKNEDVVFVHKTRVGYFAFEVGKAFFDEAGTLVNPKAANLSVSQPHEFPTFTTTGARWLAGTAITHSRAARSPPKL